MTAPNPAVGALPGWRGTDPDAPLDPGNPEHLRQVRDYLDEVNGGGAVDVRSSLQDVQDWLTGEAERLEQEQREAEQDASDRAEADNYAKESSTTEEYWARHNAYLDGMRAERARQEAGQ